ncbi:hypothetical protein PRIPAC_82046, partial [Pristionchus pacificus]|uniref:Uncharacterized protein n=1 Tax=Pristionchus pacificus TaxID=54126 RepID=A0A2A6CM96_PRIPA
MNMAIVISTLKNPQIHSFRDSRFLSCANPLRICPTLTQTASYNIYACLRVALFGIIFMSYIRCSSIEYQKVAV